jgi:alkyldihydroxyacetonephosphate synthase
MRLYDREDTAFQGLDLDGCLLVAASAGEPSVAQAEFAVIRDALASATDLGPEPWERWQRHRFDLSADRLRGYLEPTGAFLDTIELGGPWDVMEGLHQQVKSGLSAHGIALCHFSHPTLQGCCAYFTFGGSRDTEEEAERVYLACWRETMARALEAGATISHHHGVGRARRDWVKTELGGWWGVWDSVRASLDPLGTLNPNAVGGRGDKGAKNSLEDNLE